MVKGQKTIGQNIAALGVILGLHSRLAFLCCVSQISKLTKIKNKSSLASLKSRMVLSFWCQLTPDVPKKAIKPVFLSNNQVLTKRQKHELCLPYPYLVVGHEIDRQTNRFTYVRTDKQNYDSIILCLAAASQAIITLAQYLLKSCSHKTDLFTSITEFSICCEPVPSSSIIFTIIIITVTN